MSDGAAQNPTSAYWLGVAFLITATVAFFGMRWNMLEPRWAFPTGTKVMLLAAVVAAGLSRILGRTQPRATILFVGFAVPAGAFIATLVGMLKDPTSQNLWPIGLVVLGVFALLGSSLGTFVGSLILRLVNAPRTNGGT